MGKDSNDEAAQSRGTAPARSRNTARTYTRAARQSRPLRDNTQLTQTQRWIEQMLAQHATVQARQAETSAAPSHPTPPVGESQKRRQVEVRIERQPIHRIRRLEREELTEAENARGRAMAEHYSFLHGPERPTSYLKSRNPLDRARARARHRR